LITTLIIKLGTVWSAEIELSEDSTLDEVHHAIQWAVDFDNDHLYEFFVARTERARDRTAYTDEDGNLYETRIRDLFPLSKNMQLFYLFDYGDYWIFRILRSRKKPHEPVEGVEYPRVVKESGEKPIQYEMPDDEY